MPEMSEEDGMKVADLEALFAEMDGYSAESRAGEILLQAGIDESFHFGSMQQVAPGWKLRVLLAQALFANPDILLLDEPTNNLDIHTISWLATVLNQPSSPTTATSSTRSAPTWPISITASCVSTRGTTRLSWPPRR
jgi:ATPase subunit of ABC transporter with duplicated ATPase domains